MGALYEDKFVHMVSWAQWNCENQDAEEQLVGWRSQVASYEVANFRYNMRKT